MFRLKGISRKDFLQIREDLKNSSSEINKIPYLLFNYFINNKTIAKEILKGDPDLNSIANCMKINLSYESFPEGVGGISCKKFNKCFIILNETLNPSKGLYTFLHEFYHLMCGDVDYSYLLFCLDSEYDKKTDKTKYSLTCMVVKKFDLLPFLNNEKKEVIAIAEERPVLSFPAEGPPVSGKKRQGACNFLARHFKSEISDLVNKQSEVLVDTLTKRTIELINEAKKHKKKKQLCKIKN